MLTYRPLFKVCLWQAYYLHPVETTPNDLIDPVGRPNCLKTVKQEEIVSNALAVNGYSISRDLEIIPSVSTRNIMQKAKMVFQAENSGFTLWVRAQAVAANNFRPYIPLDASCKLTFVLRPKNPSFYNFTNIDDNSPSGSIYYFSNLANNQFSTSNYLNLTTPQISPPQNYASSLDLVLLRDKGTTLDVSALQTDFIRFVLTNPLHRAEFICEKTADEPFLNTCRIEVKGLPSGLYTLSAFHRNGTEIPVLKQNYFHHEGDIPRDTFGIIEVLYLTENPIGPYSLVGADQRLLAPVYTLWWQNRSTFWRYLFDQNQPLPDAANPDCHVQLEKPSIKNQLLSKTKQPLVSRYRKMCFRKPNSSEEILLPNPTADRIYSEGNDFYSEVYLNKTDFNKIFPGTS